MQKNDKIQNFFSEQLREVKEMYNRVWGKVYTENTKEAAINRCLELADFPVTMEDIHFEQIRCKCGRDTFGYVCVDPLTKFFFCVSVCECEKKGGEK